MAFAIAGCNAYDEETHSATLAGGAAVVPTSTETGAGTFNLTFKGPAAEWQLTLSPALANVTGIHIHDGAAGVAGLMYVVLYDGPTATISTLRGAFSADQVTACATAPANAGGTACVATASRTFGNIQAAAQAHTVYVDVHTTVNNAGALRGQIN